MLEHLNDYLSFIVLVIIVLFAIRICIGAFFNFEVNNNLKRRIEVLLNYSENEDE